MFLQTPPDYSILSPSIALKIYSYPVVLSLELLPLPAEQVAECDREQLSDR
jgi:hypothetical protein